MQPRQKMVGHGGEDQPPLVCSMASNGQDLWTSHRVHQVPSAAALDARLRLISKNVPLS